MEIIFRNVSDLPMPGALAERWQVEAHLGENSDRPAGLAWVAIYPPETLGPTMLYLLVDDDYRRQGVATALVRACQERWPGLTLTDGVSPGGAALLKAIDGRESIFGSILGWGSEGSQRPVARGGE